MTDRTVGTPGRVATRCNGTRPPAVSPGRPECLTAETAELLRDEIDRIQRRMDCLGRNRDALPAYLAAVQP